MDFRARLVYVYHPSIVMSASQSGVAVKGNSHLSFAEKGAWHAGIGLSEQLDLQSVRITISLRISISSL